MHTTTRRRSHRKIRRGYLGDPWDPRPFVFDLDEFPTLLPDVAMSVSNGRHSVAIWRGRSILLPAMPGATVDDLRREIGIARDD
jgi:hypothetical protein